MDVLRLPTPTGDVIEKRAENEPERARLDRERGTLEAAAGIPGIPALVGHADATGVMTTAAGSDLTALEAPPLALADLVLLLRGVADTLDGLHARGLVHGAIEPAHVVLADPVPLLCGLGAGGRAGTPHRDDPGRVLDPADDIAGWADLATHLLASAEVGNAARPGAAQAQLVALVDDARHPDARLRPDARALVVALDHRLPPMEARPARPSAIRRRDLLTPGGLLRRLRLPLTAGAAALVLVGVVPRAVAALRPARPAYGPVTATAAPCPPVPPPAADVDGDGCEEPVRWTAGVLEAGRARFALGAPGDAVVVGDWACNGRRTPALLAAGVLMIFDAWPAPGGQLTGRTVATVPSASGLSVAHGDDGCERPTIARRDGGDLIVEARR